MTCKGKRGLTAKRQETAATLSDRQRARMRLQWCWQASECGRPCEQMVKPPGKTVYCVDLATGDRMDLHGLVEIADATCPLGVW